MSELSNTETKLPEDYRLAVRAETDKLKPAFMSQAQWDEMQDEIERNTAVLFAAMMKAAAAYEADNPDEKPEPAPDYGHLPQPIEEFLQEQGLPGIDPMTKV